MFFSLVIVFIIFFLLYGYFAAKSEAKKNRITQRRQPSKTLTAPSPPEFPTAVPNIQEVLACSELPSSSKTPRG